MRYVRYVCYARYVRCVRYVRFARYRALRALRVTCVTVRCVRYVYLLEREARGFGLPKVAERAAAHAEERKGGEGELQRQQREHLPHDRVHQPVSRRRERGRARAVPPVPR